MLDRLINRLYDTFFGPRVRRWVETIIITVSIIGFLLHLLLIFLARVHLIPTYELLASPIASLYTPFSFILIYEVYLLVLYIPKSITTYITKQYEIITLIVIRRIFKDLALLASFVSCRAE
jgi:hypothetical protein